MTAHLLLFEVGLVVTWPDHSILEQRPISNITTWTQRTDIEVFQLVSMRLHHCLLGYPHWISNETPLALSEQSPLLHAWVTLDLLALSPLSLPPIIHLCAISCGHGKEKKKSRDWIERLGPFPRGITSLIFPAKTHQRLMPLYPAARERATGWLGS